MARGPVTSWGDWDEGQRSITVVERDEFEPTGVLDPTGKMIYRIREHGPIGFDPKRWKASGG